MALPTPLLDDRRFQDLVDDAKRLVQRRCPEWTDHNVSDPGVTLIEAFAFLVDQLLFRLNQVPDRNYVKFLELIGVRLFPPTAAKADLTFWLSAPRSQTFTIPVGTAAATLRTPTQEAVVFSTTESVDIVNTELFRVAVGSEERKEEDQTDAMQGDGFFCFGTPPKAGDCFYIGLSEAVPSNAVTLRVTCRIEGVGVDPTNPPLEWEAWTEEGWVGCAVDRDDTGGLNQGGDVVLHVPRGHVVSVIARSRGGWLRCRLREPEEDQPFYSASPRVTALQAFTIGGTAAALNAETINEEVLGISDGTPGQRFSLRFGPVVAASEPPVVEVATGDGWEQWQAVESFADSSPDDRHFLIDAVAGEVQLGPAVREADGRLVAYGAVPPPGATLRIRSYRVGGGVGGNVTRGALSILKSSLPFVARVENRHAGTGGSDGEDLTNAKRRGPVLLRTRNRAVTVEDYEQLTCEAAPEVARVRCVPGGETDGAAIRVLVVPKAAAGTGGQLEFVDLVLSDEVLERVTRYLDERRVVGTRLSVEMPFYQGITVVARLRARSNVNDARLREDALAALHSYFNPLSGGPDGGGWPFGRPVHVGEVYSVLQRLPGTEFVEDLQLRHANPIDGTRGEPVQRVEIDANALVFSYMHQVMVQSS